MSQEQRERRESEVQRVLNALDLDSSVPRDRLMRGVKVSHILHGGKSIMQPLRFDAYTDVEGERLFSQSETVSHFDDFLSHSWRTSPLEKAIALRLLYNVYPAMIASVAAALLFFPLARTGLLPAMNRRHYSASAGGVVPLSAYSTAAGGAVFVVALFFWQTGAGWCMGRALRQRPKMAFFDKLSIHQTDQALKPAGIRSLGGFLKLSRRFVILWHRDYFTRLWCIYEVAAFEYLNRPENQGGVFSASSSASSQSNVVNPAFRSAEEVAGMAKKEGTPVEEGGRQQDEQDEQDGLLGEPGSILFVPCPLLVIVASAHAALLLAMTVGFSLVLKSGRGGSEGSGSSGSFSPRSVGSTAYVLYLMLIALVLLLPACAFAAALRRFMADRLDLERQLAAFSTAGAGCSDPNDRKRVERSIALWWSLQQEENKGDGEEEKQQQQQQQKQAPHILRGFSVLPKPHSNRAAAPLPLSSSSSSSSSPSADLEAAAGGGSGGGVTQRQEGGGDAAEAMRVAALGRFDHYVHTRVAELVADVTGSPTAPSHALLSSTGTPLLWVALDWTASFKDESAAFQVGWALRGLLWGLLLVPLLWHIFLRCTIFVNIHAGRYAAGQQKQQQQPQQSLTERKCSSCRTAAVVDALATLLLAAAIIVACLLFFAVDMLVHLASPLTPYATSTLEIAAAAVATRLIWGERWPPWELVRWLLAVAAGRVREEMRA